MSFINLLCYLWITIATVASQKGALVDYCNHETFDPECKDNEVIEIQSAYYGQMRLGRCVEQNYGHLGCSADVLSEMDKECSGRTSCNIVVAHMTEPAVLNCSIPKIFTRYLQVQYICTRVTVMDEEKCQIMMKSGKHNIASTTALSSQCGTETNPWTLQAKSGQRINISLTDFNWNPQNQNLIGCVQRYGYIIDMESKIVTNICGKTGKKKQLLFSDGSLLHVVLSEESLNDVPFILSVQAVGCPVFDSPVDTWTKEGNGILTVGCVHNDKKWKMRCIGNHWIGIVGKCDKEMKSVDDDQQSPRKSEDSVFVVVYSLIGCVFLVILCVMMTTVISYFCIRKPKQEQGKGYCLAPVSTMYPTATNIETLPFHRTVLRSEFSNDVNQTLSTGTLVAGRQDIDIGLNPNYFVLEGRDDGLKEPIYDAVYQNVDDVRNV